MDWVKNIVTTGEIAYHEQFLLMPPYFKQETAEDGKAGLSAIWPWKSTNQGQCQSNHRNQ